LPGAADARVLLEFKEGRLLLAALLEDVLPGIPLPVDF